MLTLRQALKTQIFALAAIGTLGLTGASASAGDQLAMVSVRPIAPFSTIFKSVENRADYGAFVGVRYDDQNRAYDLRYTADDGTAKALKIDAVTGKELNTVVNAAAR